MRWPPAGSLQQPRRPAPVRRLRRHRHRSGPAPRHRSRNDGRPDNADLLVRESHPRDRRHRRAGHLGGTRLGHVRPDRQTPGTAGQVEAVPRGVHARHARADHGPRRTAAVRQLPGIGIIAGWLAVILGLSFYARKWIGVKTWRATHRFTIVVYLLALGHVVGAGIDGQSLWMVAMLSALTAPIVFAFTYRVLAPAPGRSAPTSRRNCAGRFDGTLRIPRPPQVAKVES
jgi:hypothetical protein